MSTNKLTKMHCAVNNLNVNVNCFGLIISTLAYRWFFSLSLLALDESRERKKYQLTMYYRNQCKKKDINLLISLLYDKKNSLHKNWVNFMFKHSQITNPSSLEKMQFNSMACMHAVDETNNSINLYTNEMKLLLRWFLLFRKKNIVNNNSKHQSTTKQWNAAL